MAHFARGERRSPFFDASVITDVFQKAGVEFGARGRVALRDGK
jgi:hypothetical protein